ncbi:MAG TPA: 2OG-Fe(II) oxygenase [Acetobacteraceae bacterium]|nr:2OG-Fe(II) oxygenase [Acetobacteraceae bacterium]
MTCPDSWRGVIDAAAFARSQPARTPFPHVVLPGFVLPTACAAARAVFPDSGHGGIAPAAARDPADGLGRLLAALRDPQTTALFAEKFDETLDPDALMIHLRARCTAQDGRIHTDSARKRLTALIYLNEAWPHPGGRLRLLRGPHDLEDMLAEVPPLDGTLIAFRRSDISWHGHHPFEGVRRAVMFNWMESAADARHETMRHAASAAVKRIAAAATRRHAHV